MSKKKRKTISKKRQSELLRKQGYSYAQINKMDSATRQKISTLIISDQNDQRKEKGCYGENER